ncbi:acyl-homoserine-lactone synthase [Antarcticimicrobium sediminis]|uniref:Acyl-homoserine-lactone synthase n=1 Tax=Antarcticimicrobium sediminis TaxID=2546227 RepID=A0A4R5EZJ7_9RHOB|nr:acyl-homoserine-lactone synthase [Antarcticimicrobium sediminis]TDE40300.1 GNAT family N-acetyltransferase [Antarcticimicrobium sediminis]
MIIVVDALNKHRFSALLDEMHKLRARVFHDRLGRDVTVRDGKEIDSFDHLDPAHVICLDAEGDVVGSMRLLQTTGPHMLSDMVHALLDDDAPLRSGQVWEATRFCVDTQKLSDGKTRNSISYVTSEVMIGAFEYARDAGVLDAVAVIDPVMSRVMTRCANAPYDYLGAAKPMGKGTDIAALIDCSDERIAGIRAFAGIDHDVFLSEDDALDIFNRNRDTAIGSAKVSHLVPHQTKAAITLVPDALKTALQLYCFEQMRDAESQTDLDAALALMEALSEEFGTAKASELGRMMQSLPRHSRTQVQATLN